MLLAISPFDASQLGSWLKSDVPRERNKVITCQTQGMTLQLGMQGGIQYISAQIGDFFTIGVFNL